MCMFIMAIIKVEGLVSLLHHQRCHTDHGCDKLDEMGQREHSLGYKICGIQYECSRSIPIF